VFCIYSSLEAKFFPAIRVFDGYVILSGPVDFQTSPLERREHIRAAGHGSLLYALPQIFVNSLLGLGSFILPWRFAPAKQAGLVQIRVFRRV
jgi:hypothetical protein